MEALPPGFFGGTRQDLWEAERFPEKRRGPTRFWGLSRAKTKFSHGDVKIKRNMVSIHGPLGYEPNTLTTALLRSCVEIPQKT